MSLIVVDTTEVEYLARLYHNAAAEAARSRHSVHWDALQPDTQDRFRYRMQAFLSALVEDSTVPDSFIQVAEERISAAVQTKLALEPELRALLTEGDARA